MNDPFVNQQCQAAGARMARADGNVNQRIDSCFQQVLIATAFGSRAKNGGAVRK